MNNVLCYTDRMLLCIAGDEDCAWSLKSLLSDHSPSLTKAKSLYYIGGMFSESPVRSAVIGGHVGVDISRISCQSIRATWYISQRASLFFP